MTEQTVKKGRKPREAQDIEPINEAAFEKDAQALIVHSQQATEALSRIGYDEPYDRERVVQETRFYMGQSAEAMLEAGRRLIVLKECEPHGVFTDIVENRLKINLRTAQRMMAAATKFIMNPALGAKATALSLLGTTKLLELMTESDEDLAELAEGGTVAGMTLDEIDRMTTRELKAALREAKEDLQSKNKMLDKKNRVIDALEVEKNLIQTLTPSETVKRLRREAFSCMGDISSAIGAQLQVAVQRLLDEDRDSNISTAYQLLSHLKRQIYGMFDEFGIPSEMGGDIDRSWIDEVNEEKAQQLDEPQA